MLGDLVRALFLAGVPVALMSYVLVWWSLRRGFLSPAGSVRDLEKDMKRMSKLRRQEKKKRKQDKKNGTAAADDGATESPLNRIDPVHGKWVAFGGGFYGVVALLTYVIIEFGELRDFFLGFESLAALLDQLGLNMLISLLVEAVVNFVTAIAWPVYWLSEISMINLWVWLGAAYLGYWAGVKAALHRHGGTATQSERL
jgi:hypothetical protein